MSIGNPDDLPKLNDEELAAMDSIPLDIIDQLWDQEKRMNAMSKAGQWGVSTDQEIFRGSHETRDAAIEAAREYKGVRVWIGQSSASCGPEENHG